MMKKWREEERKIKKGMKIKNEIFYEIKKRSEAL
jgi:hypothetical protein